MQRTDRVSQLRLNTQRPAMQAISLAAMPSTWQAVCVQMDLHSVVASPGPAAKQLQQSVESVQSFAELQRPTEPALPTLPLPALATLPAPADEYPPALTPPTLPAKGVLPVLNWPPCACPPAPVIPPLPAGIPAPPAGLFPLSTEPPQATTSTTEPQERRRCRIRPVYLLWLWRHEKSSCPRCFETTVRPI